MFNIIVQNIITLLSPILHSLKDGARNINFKQLQMIWHEGHSRNIITPPFLYFHVTTTPRACKVGIYSLIDISSNGLPSNPTISPFSMPALSTNGLILVI